MFEFINYFVVREIDLFTRVIAFLILFTVGYIYISFKGGIPRIGNQIINKGQSFIVAVVIVLVSLFVVEPIVERILNYLITTYIDLAIPSALIIGGIAVREFDKRMRWDYKYYWIIPLTIGFIWFILEIIY